MTLVIGKRCEYNSSFEMMADTRITGSSAGISNSVKKITKLDDMLLGIAGDYIPMELIEELYSKWKSEKFVINFNLETNIQGCPQPETIFDIIDFLDYVKSNSKINDCQTMFMVMTKKLGFIYMESGSVEMMETNKFTNSIMAMGDSAKFVYMLRDIAKSKGVTLEDSDYFDAISNIDVTVSSDYESLKITDINAFPF